MRVVDDQYSFLIIPLAVLLLVVNDMLEGEFYLVYYIAKIMTFVK